METGRFDKITGRAASVAPHAPRHGGVVPVCADGRSSLSVDLGALAQCQNVSAGRSFT